MIARVWHGRTKPDALFVSMVYSFGNNVAARVGRTAARHASTAWRIEWCRKHQRALRLSPFFSGWHLIWNRRQHEPHQSRHKYASGRLKEI
jgi:hypothetical protein